MKILLVSRGVLPFTVGLTGGAEYFLLRTAEQLAERGHEVHVVASGDETVVRRLTDLGIELRPVLGKGASGAAIFRLGFWGWLLAHAWGGLMATISAALVIRSERFDVVHCHGSIVSVLLRFMFWHLPLVYTQHDAGPWLGDYPRRIERWIRKFAFVALDVQAARLSQQCTVVYNNQRRFLCDRWGIPENKISVVPPGVNTEEFAPADPCDRKGILFVGHLIERKGVGCLVELIDQDPELRLTIVGDGPLREEFAAELVARGLASRVTMVGVIPNHDLPAYFRNARATVMPSRSEGLPLTVLESLSSGTPVACFDVGGLGDIIRNGWNGYVSPQGSLRQLGRDLSTLTNANQDQVGLMSDRARQTVVNNYSWQAIGAHLELIYAKVAERRHRH